MTREYQVRAKRLRPGAYELSYGRGSKKLTATVGKTTDGGWASDSPDIEADTLKDLKASWGRWAEATYNGNGSTPRSSDGESPEYRQAQIDEAPNYETALHIYHIANQMEEVSAHFARYNGRHHHKHHYRKPQRKDYP